MSYFEVSISREVTRMTALRDTYERQLSELPKGSLRTKERNGKRYHYLSYRRDGKVVSEYVGIDEAIINDLRNRLERRKGIESLLKRIRKELVLMNKALEVSR